MRATTKLAVLLEELRDSFRLMADDTDRTVKDGVAHAYYRAGMSDGFNVAMLLVQQEDEKGSK